MYDLMRKKNSPQNKKRKTKVKLIRNIYHLTLNNNQSIIWLACRYLETKSNVGWIILEQHLKVI